MTGMKSAKQLNYYPVVVAGGGIIGKAVALGLSKILNLPQGQPNVCLIDSQEIEKVPANPIATYSNRVSFIKPSSRNLLKRILSSDQFNGLFNMNLVSEKPTIWPVHDMQIIDCDVSPRLGLQSTLSTFYRSHMQFSSKESSMLDMLLPYPRSDSLGWILQNNIIEKTLDIALLSQINDKKLQYFSRSQLISIDNKLAATGKQFLQPCRQLVVEQAQGKGLPILTSLIIGCDGNNSKVRQLLNIPYSSYDYCQNGIVGTVKVSAEHNKYPLTAFQRFLSIGPIALLPMNIDTYSFVWSVPKSLSILLTKTISEEEFLTLLNLACYGDYSDLIYTLRQLELKYNGLTFDLVDNTKPFTSLSGIQLPPQLISLEKNSRASFPLRMGITPRSVSAQTVLLGDAAHSVHPLAGQGLNMGFSDINTFLDVMQRNVLELGCHPGDFQVLSDYSQLQDGWNIASVAVIDGMVRNFVRRGIHTEISKDLSLTSLLEDCLEYGSRPGILESIRRSGMTFLPGSFRNILVRLAS